MRERLIGLVINSSFALVVALLASFYAFKRDGNAALAKDVEAVKLTKADRTELEKKLDKSEFAEYTRKQDQTREQDKKDLIMYFDTRFEDLKDFIKIVSEKNK